MPRSYDDDVSRNWQPRTKLVRAGINRSEHGEISEGLFLTQGYAYDSAETAQARFKGEADGFIYSRFGNPTVDIFEKRMAILEGADVGIATATGMAAVFASLMSQLGAGDHLIASRALFGSIAHILTQILPRYGIEATLVDGKDLDAWQGAVRKTTRVFLLETPSNPTLELIDIPAVAEIAHAAGARLIVDNVFATPILQQPLTLGADIVLYSATKHIDGQGRVLGGIVLGSEDYIENELRGYLRHTGPALSPFNAWVLIKGLETLDLRVREGCTSAMAVAEFLTAAKGVSNVLYPGHPNHPQRDLVERQMQGGGTVVTFDVDGGTEGAFRFINALELIDISNNLGDVKSLITHPGTTTHQRLSPEEQVLVGIQPGTVRLSIGLEDIKDIQADIEQALHGS